MSNNDYQNQIRIQRHASLIDQAQSLRGLHFTVNDTGREFMVFETNVNTRNEILITGVCTQSPSGKESGLFAQFELHEIVLTSGSVKILSQRLCRDAGDPNWGAK